MPYTPTVWGNNNPKLTPDLMNKLEGGVVQAQADADEINDILIANGIKNIYDGITTTGYLNAEGTITIDTISKTTDYYDCIGGSNLTVRKETTSTIIVAFYNNTTFISRYYKSTNNLTCDIPSNANKFRVTISTSDSDVVIYSDKINAIIKQNDSLDDYGLVNQFSGNVVQGYHAPNTGVYDSSYKYAVTDTTKYPCVAGNDVSVKVKGNASGVFIVWYNGASYLSYTSANSLEINAKAPTNATHFTINIQSGSQITPQAISHIGVYIDNAIDKLKNDLSKKTSSYIIGRNQTATIKRIQPYIPIIIVVADSANPTICNGIYIWGVWGFSTIATGNGITVTADNDNVTLTIANGRSATTGMLLISDQELKVTFS